MATLKIEIPATLKDYTIHQVNNILEYFKRDLAPDRFYTEDPLNIVSAVTGIPVETLALADYKKGIVPAYNIIRKHIAYTLPEPPKEIIVNGEVYYFNTDVGHEDWHAGRLVDAHLKGVQVGTEPEYAFAICYIEKGKKYGYPESEGGCMPTAKRAAIMREHANGEQYLNWYGFFLKKYWELYPGYLALQIARTTMNPNTHSKKSQKKKRPRKK